MCSIINAKSIQAITPCTSPILCPRGDPLAVRAGNGIIFNIRTTQPRDEAFAHPRSGVTIKAAYKRKCVARDTNRSRGVNLLAGGECVSRQTTRMEMTSINAPPTKRCHQMPPSTLVLRSTSSINHPMTNCAEINSTVSQCNVRATLSYDDLCSNCVSIKIPPVNSFSRRCALRKSYVLRFIIGGKN